VVNSGKLAGQSSCQIKAGHSFCYSGNRGWAINLCDGHTPLGRNQGSSFENI